MYDPYDDYGAAAETQPQPILRPTLPTWRAFALLGVGGVVFVALVSIVLVVLFQPTPVTLVIDGNARQLNTQSATVRELLREQGVALHQGDLLSPSLDTALQPDIVVRLERARGVTLNIDGKTSTIWTPLTSPADILASEGVTPAEDDRIVIDGTEAHTDDLALWPVPPLNITVRRAVPITISDAGEPRTLLSTGATVGDALYEAGVTLYLADTVSPDLSTPLQPELHIDIYRSRPLTIFVDGERVETRTRGTTVADALADAGVALVGLDYAVPAEGAALRPGMHIRVIRVREETVTETVPLLFETIYQADAGVELDTVRVAQEGREGVEERRLRVRYENGYEIRREVVETVVAQPPQNRVITYGTNVVVRSIETPDGTREYWRVLRMYATSYHPAALDGDDVTATGRKLQKGIVSIDPDIIPYGSEVFVPGYGVGVAADTGGLRANPLWIDLGYSDADFQHWARPVDVYLLTPVPPEIDYILP
jgi:uncharacterized protein YabE (DUF348 family)